MGNSHQNRQQALRKQMEERRADAFVIVHPQNVYYLCGFAGSSSALLIELEGATFFTDSRYTIQAREEVQGAEVRIERGVPLARAAAYLRKRTRGGGLRIGYEASHVSVAEMAALRAAAGRRVKWQACTGVVEGLRAVKDEEELARMRQAARLGSTVLEEVVPLLKPGLLEVEVAAEIEYRMRRRGASGPAFETIVASGARSALPHARATLKPLRKNELVTLDLGAILRHYCSDLTRTFYLGRAPQRIRRWYRAVLSAQGTAIAALRPGVAAGQVDRAARRVLEGAGLGAYFVHSTGHGLGLEVHEGPRLARGQKAKLEAGNVVTIEPGVYVEGVGGIRIEDDVAIHAGGSEVLTTAPRELVEL